MTDASPGQRDRQRSALFYILQRPGKINDVLRAKIKALSTDYTTKDREDETKNAC